MSFDFEGLKPPKGCSKYDYFDWYDHPKVEKINQARSKQWLKLYAKLREAKETGDDKALARTRESIRNHEAEDKILKRKAEESGFYWF